MLRANWVQSFCRENQNQKTMSLSNEQIINSAFGARDFVLRLGIFLKNSIAIPQKNNDVLGQKVSS